MIPEIQRSLPARVMGAGFYHYSGLRNPRCIRKYGRPKPTDVVLDVGSMHGEFTIPAARHASHVHAVEPDPDNVAYLRRSTASIDNVSVHHVGAWRSSGYMSFEQCDDPSETAIEKIGSDTAPRNTVDVEVLPLSDLPFINDISWMKIDAEGAEYEVLEGLGDALPRTIRVDVSGERSGCSDAEGYAEAVGVSHQLEGYGYDVQLDGKTAIGWRDGQ